MLDHDEQSLLGDLVQGSADLLRERVLAGCREAHQELTHKPEAFEAVLRGAGLVLGYELLELRERVGDRGVPCRGGHQRCHGPKGEGRHRGVAQGSEKRRHHFPGRHELLVSSLLDELLHAGKMRVREAAAGMAILVDV